MPKLSNAPRAISRGRFPSPHIKLNVLRRRYPSKSQTVKPSWTVRLGVGTLNATSRRCAISGRDKNAQTIADPPDKTSCQNT